MKKTIGVVLAVALASMLAGCMEDDVPAVSDPAKPVVNGQAMTGQTFLEKYCSNKSENETCAAVQKAMSKSSH
ncbi:hypothetical protein [Pseudomonas sp. JG-B]|uniref:hypothetical protein n=1 Tax=Pseudomonas sp. JG-B TaxID=2603214 RepID=UPI00129D9CD1|nr:hypothetical protein [Pseudomonas sp. JG-B]MRK19087.1 hypothetical protein [Pseudomonas sp. JG-B]